MRIYLVALMLGVVATNTGFAQQQNLADGARRTTEPVFRVSKRVEDKVEKIASAKPDAQPNVLPSSAAPAKPANQPHPLDQALETARSGLDHIQSNIHDYTAIMVKRERVNNVVGDREYMKVKIRNERTIDGNHVPFSVYMRFLKPKACSGREVIYVKGNNDGKLLVHDGTGVGSLKTFHLDPAGWLAMKDNRYPIYEAGIENLVVKLIEKANRDRAAGHCEVEYRSGANINKRPCSMIQVIHNDRRQPYEFYKAQIFIDDELKIPVRYAAYDWPTAPGQEPQLLEEYTYVNVKINVGLTDADFDPANDRYKFPGH